MGLQESDYRTQASTTSTTIPITVQPLASITGTLLGGIPFSSLMRRIFGGILF